MEVRVGSYNIHCIPVFGCSDAYVEDKVAPYVQAFVEEERLHILVLNEAFRAKVKTAIMRLLGDTWSSSTYVNRPGGVMPDTGVLVFWDQSKVTLRQSMLHRFTRCCGTDCFANKGCLGVVFETVKGGRSFQLVATHLQDMEIPILCSSNVRTTQFESLRRVRRTLGDAIPGMYIGDMNQPPNEDMARILDATPTNLEPTHEGRALDYGLVFGGVQGRLQVPTISRTNPSDHRPVIVRMRLPSSLTGGSSRRRKRPSPINVSVLQNQYQDTLERRFKHWIEAQADPPSYVKGIDFARPFGADKQGMVFEYLDKRPYLIKIGPTGDLVSKDHGFRDSMADGGTYVENFSVHQSSHPFQTNVVKIQNRMAKSGYAPAVVAAGVFDGNRVTVMEKIQKAVNLEDRNVDRRRVLRYFARKLKKRGLCHHDLHTRNVVYGTLHDDKKRYYLIDFDNSFFLQDRPEVPCNDTMQLDSDNMENIQFQEAVVSMPSTTRFE